MSKDKRPEWMYEAACIGVDPDIFFPEQGESLQPAKDVCHRCPVRQICLEYALACKETHGVWGGTSDRQRRQIRKQRQLNQQVVA